jgi:hypothetical protein
MVDGQKPQTLLETLNVTNQDPNIYAIFTVLTAQFGVGGRLWRYIK